MVVTKTVNIKISKEYKTRRNTDIQLQKIEYKSSSAAELEGGRHHNLWHKPVYTFSLTLFLLKTETSISSVPLNLVFQLIRYRQCNYPTTMSIPAASNTNVSKYCGFWFTNLITQPCLCNIHYLWGMQFVKLGTYTSCIKVQYVEMLVRVTSHTYLFSVNFMVTDKKDSHYVGNVSSLLDSGADLWQCFSL